jgi:hypothetical protein
MWLHNLNFIGIGGQSFYMRWNWLDEFKKLTNGYDGESIIPNVHGVATTKIIMIQNNGNVGFQVITFGNMQLFKGLYFKLNIKISWLRMLELEILYQSLMTRFEVHYLHGGLPHNYEPWPFWKKMFTNLVYELITRHAQSSHNH